MILSAVSAMLVVSSLLMVWMRSILNNIKILALQSLFLSAACLQLAVQTHLAELYLIALLTLVVKAFLIPRILDATMRRIQIRKEAEKFIGRGAAILLAAGLTGFSYALTGRMGAFVPGAQTHYLADAVSLVLIGLFLMLVHKKAVMQGIGLIVMENGLFLFALATASGMPLMVDIGIFLDVFVTAILIGMLSYRMNQTFKSLSTEWLRQLKG